jgi:DNA mismatch repair protein MutL
VGRVNRLPVDLANQIAAGEVVERPASVVKELVENAIDANAKRVSITVELGGKRLIRVEDDGEGMEPDDARLALERHATSKISSANDLAAITTLGFRGEALPSIASVSRFRLRTRSHGRPTGIEIRVHAGATVSEEETGAPVGTLVEVEDLFYNLPARRKFLKADSAESAQVSRLVTLLALGFPEVGFTLVSAGRTALQGPPVAGLAERLYQIYGDRPDLVEVRRQSGGLSLYGYVAALTDRGPVRGSQNVFVNRRSVRDRTIAHAIISAYSEASIKERSPEVHLFIQMPPDWVDVNVHPTKAEVRFRDQSLVHEVVRRAVLDALGRETMPAFQLHASTLQGRHPVMQMIPGVMSRAEPLSGWPITDALPGDVARNRMESTTGQAETQAFGAPMPASGDAQPGPTVSMGPLVPLGQFRDTFIIAVDDEGVAVIDQHVAHERILFERVMERLTRDRLESQGLLEPLLIDLPAANRQALLSHQQQLARLGFEAEEFGGDSIRVTAVPAILGRADAARMIRALAEDLEGLDPRAGMDEALRRVAALTACHAAVKAHDPLTMEKMVHILEELRQTAYSTVCPHGRPVMLRLTRREIEKNFERI